MRMLLISLILVSTSLQGQSGLPGVGSFGGFGGYGLGDSGGAISGMNELPEDYYAISSLLQNSPDFPKVEFLQAKANTEERSLVEDYDRGVRELLDKIPESDLKKGLEKYLEIINAKSYNGDASVAGSNSGIIAYNQNTISNNVCFAKLAEAFYQDIQKQDYEILFQNNSGIQSNDALRGRPSLKTSSGQGALKDLPPGWLLEKALKYSDGDPNLAFNLISVCGHDDINQGSFKYQVGAKKVIQGEEKNKYLNVINYMIKQQESVLNPAFQKYSQELKDFRNKLTSGDSGISIAQDRSIFCPSNTSTFYYSKALGEEADLPDEFKNNIATLQAPNEGKSVIPAKNYHFMASAFMSCSLVSQGVHPKMAATIQKLAGWAYRTVRMNEILKNDLEFISDLENKYDVFVKNFNQSHSKKVSTSRGTRTKNERAPLFEEWLLSYRSSEQTKLEQGNSSFFMSFQKMNFEDLEGVKKFLIRYDAAKVLDELTAGGGSVLGLPIPHTNISLSFTGDPVAKHLELQDKKNKGLREKRRMTNHGPKSWSKERYEKAKSKAMTYLIDWEWTAKQHEIGAKFSSKLCTKQEPHTTPDTSACSALEGGPGVVCDIDYSALPSSQNSGMLSGLAGQLGAISSHMTDKYVDSEIQVNETPMKMQIEGLY